MMLSRLDCRASCAAAAAGRGLCDDFSFIEHVQQLVTSSAQTNYALRVLRCHGLSSRLCSSSIVPPLSLV